MDDKMIYNWTNTLRYDDNAHYEFAKNAAEQYKNKGFHASEAIDLLLAKNFDMKLVQAAVECVYQKPTIKTIVSTKRHIPTKYADISKYIENTLTENSAEEFIKIISPIVITSDKNLATLRRMAQMAKDNQTSFKNIHEFLMPYMEEELYQSVITCENDKNIKTASSEYNVNVDNFTCECEKFITRNYTKLGLVCEHIIAFK